MPSFDISPATRRRNPLSEALSLPGRSSGFYAPLAIVVLLAVLGVNING
jgi:hypothetical protein